VVGIDGPKDLLVEGRQVKGQELVGQELERLVLVMGVQELVMKGQELERLGLGLEGQKLEDLEGRVGHVGGGRRLVGFRRLNLHEKKKSA
jgi:hypothetical protein